MVRRTFLILILMLIAVVGAGGSAAGATAPDRLRVSLWPEYDDNQVFLVETVTYPDDLPLPIEVKLAMPKGAKVSWTGEILGADPSKDLAATPKVVELADHDEVVFTLTKSRIGQLEARWAGLKIQGKQRTIGLDWTQYYEAKETLFELRKPSGVTDLNLSPPFDKTVASPGGDEFVRAAPQSLSVGQTVNLTIAYARSTNAPTVNRAQPQPQAGAGQPQSSGATQDSGGQTMLAVVFIILGVGTAAYVAYFLSRAGSRTEK